MKALRNLCIATALILGIGMLASWVVAGKLVQPQRQSIGSAPPDLPVTDIFINSRSGSTLAGWHIRATPSKGVVVLLHGIRSSRRSMAGRAHFLHAAGFSVIMIDFQAHGESPGKRITVGHLEKHDVRAAVGFAQSYHPDEPIGIIGVSLGGAAAILASPLQVAALVVESVYPDIRSAVHNRVSVRLGPLSWLPAESLLVQLEPRMGIPVAALRPIAKIGQVAAPVFILSGSKDRHTTVEETEKMFALAGEPKALWLVKGAAHVNLHAAAPVEYERRVLRFLSRHMLKADVNAR